MRSRVAIRILDLVFATAALLILLPFFILMIPVLLIAQGSPVFFSQFRSGRRFQPFAIYKLRTMVPGSDDENGLTLGLHDGRITRIGYLLRKYKLDELPQFVNIWKGDMSLVGSRPQVPYYAERFREFYDQILVEKPGLLSPAAIQFANEEELLDAQPDPTGYYENTLVPVKCMMDIELVARFGVATYFSVIFDYAAHLFRLKRHNNDSIS